MTPFEQNDIPASFITMRYLKCECNELFFSEETIQEHFVSTMHKNIISDLMTFQCNICTKTTDTEQALLSHHYMLHRSNHRAFNASRPRVKKELPEEQQMLKSCKDCRYCGKTLKTASSRYIHERIHNGQRPYKCKFCDRAFINKPNLMAHHYSHTGERPYRCDLCIMAFRSVSNLKRHKQAHAGIKPYSCSTCNRTFATRCEVKSHHDLIHLRLPFPYKRKPRGQGRERMTVNLMMKKLMESEE